MIAQKERIGAMRERIVIQSYTESQSSSGHESLTYSTLATVWAAVEHKAGGSDERQLSDRKTAVTRVDFRIRRRTDIDEKMRITWGGDTYDILSILEMPDKFFQIIETVKRV